jgi:hypothetical protein
MIENKPKLLEYFSSMRKRDDEQVFVPYEEEIDDNNNDFIKNNENNAFKYFGLIFGKRDDEVEFNDQYF